MPAKKRRIHSRHPRIPVEIIRLAEQGECPYCHFRLEEHTVNVFQQPMLKFWKCTSEHCSLMFWRRPRRRESVIRH